MKCWIFVFFAKELMVSLTEAVGGTPPPVSNPSEPLTFAEIEVFRQHLLANGRWLVGLGKEELRLLSRLTGSDIGGDFLTETSYMDNTKPDFESPKNSYQHVYPGSPSHEASSSISQANKNHTKEATFSSLMSGSSGLSLTHPTFSPGIPSSVTSEGNTQDSLNNTTNLTQFSPSITDPSDDDIVFTPLPAAGNTPNTPSDSNNSNDLQTSESLNAPIPNASQSASNETQITSSGNQSSEPMKPTVDPLIYPVQFYNEASLPQSKPSTQHPSGDNFNPLANLAEKYSDNFMGW